MTPLAEAALRALDALAPGGELGGAAADPRSGATVDRVSLEVVVEGRSEIVTVALREGRLLCVSSDGREDGPHVVAALRLLAGVRSGPPRASGAGQATAAATVHPERPSAAPLAADRVAARLDDVITAVARVGASAAAGAPSVAEAIERLLAAHAQNATPLELARWVGRLRAAFARRDPDLVARLLDGAARVATVLRGGASAPEGAGRALAAWAGHEVQGARVHERRMVEVAREWLAGLARAEIQRRYLVDLDTGAVYREERRRDASASVGPCPRKLAIGLATAAPGVPPEPLRLLQYEVEPAVDGDSWRILEGHAERDIAALTERYRQLQRSFPGLAEPFVLVAPARVDRSPRLVLGDERGHVLSIARADDPAAAAVLEAACEPEPPRWIAGRLVDERGTLLLAPVAAVFGSGDATRHLRLR